MDKLVFPGSINSKLIRIMMISEGLPEKIDDYYYSSGSSLYISNTISAFNNAGIKVNSIRDILDKGVYLTSAVKTHITGNAVTSELIALYSAELEAEIQSFPDCKAILLMGDVAIKAFNLISKRLTGTRTIPAGSTYKIRKQEFYFQNIRVFPSYLQTGKNFLIEKSKREMVAEDIREAFKLL